MNVRPERTERIRMNVPLIITRSEVDNAERSPAIIPQLRAALAPSARVSSCPGRTSEIYAGARAIARAAGTMHVFPPTAPCPACTSPHATCQTAWQLAVETGEWRDEDPLVVEIRSDQQQTLIDQACR